MKMIWNFWWGDEPDHRKIHYWIAWEKMMLPKCKDRWTKRGGELGLFQFLKQSKATLTYAMLVRHQFTNRITKLPTQARRDKT